MYSSVDTIWVLLGAALIVGTILLLVGYAQTKPR